MAIPMVEATTEREVVEAIARLLKTPIVRDPNVTAADRMAYALRFRAQLKKKTVGTGWNRHHIFAHDNERKDDGTLETLWGQSDLSLNRFMRVAKVASDGCDLFECSECHTPRWSTQRVALYTQDADRHVCTSCAETGKANGSWFRCERHGTFIQNGTVRFGEKIAIRDGLFACQKCYLDRGLLWCGRCSTWGVENCQACEQCKCKAPTPKFEFRNGTDTIRQNQRVTVHINSGGISEQGIRLIRNAISGWNGPYQVVDTMDRAWQTKEGNFPKRVQRAMFKHNGFKATPELITQIGNYARTSIPAEADYHIELTRDLNGSAAMFAHGGSCWWTNYTKSRCALKLSGGLAIRAYADAEKKPRVRPIGRAWILPINDTGRDAAANLSEAPMFVVFNGYGTLVGYEPARIVAQMTGLTYKKIGFTGSPMSINGNNGYLIASAENCAKFATISIGTLAKHAMAPQPQLEHWPDVQRRMMRERSQEKLPATVNLFGFCVQPSVNDRLLESLRAMQYVA